MEEKPQPRWKKISTKYINRQIEFRQLYIKLIGKKFRNRACRH